MLAIYEFYLLLFSELIHKPRPCGPSSGPSSFSSHVWTSWICFSGVPNLFMSPSGLFHLLSWRLLNSVCPKWRTNYPYTHTSPWIWQPREECRYTLELANRESLHTLPPVLLGALCPHQPIHRKESSHAGLPDTPLSPPTTPLLEWLSEPPLLFLNTSAVESHPALVCWALIFPPWVLDNVLYITKGKCFHLYSLRWSFCSPSLPPVQSCCFTLASVSVTDMHKS